MIRRGFWVAFWAAVAVALWRSALAPARVQKLRVGPLSGASPSYASFSWGYSAGSRPQSIIFDLELAGGATGSVTTDGEASEAEVPFGSAAAGPYRVSATATYRILGVVHSREYRFAGELA